MMNTILTPEELAWAFGPDYGGYSRRQSPQLWNDLHSDLFTIHGSDEVSVTERKIKEAYKKLSTAQEQYLKNPNCMGSGKSSAMFYLKRNGLCSSRKAILEFLSTVDRPEFDWYSEYVTAIAKDGGGSPEIKEAYAWLQDSAHISQPQPVIKTSKD